MQGLIVLSDSKICDALNELLDPWVLRGEISIEFLQVGQTKDWLLWKIFDLFGFSLIIDFQVRHLTLVEAPGLQFFYGEPVHREGVSWVVEPSIVYVLSDAYRENARHMLIILLLSQ